MREKVPRLCRLLVALSFAVEFINIVFTVLDCNTLQLAILQRNVSQVEHIIKVSPSTVHFQNAMGQTPLHLAADWPRATVLLLLNGASPDQTDSHGYTAIDYACELQNYEVVKILLEEGASLPANGPLRDIIACRMIHAYKEIGLQLLRLIISHLAIRRRELLQIARTLLPEATLKSIVPPNEGVPDSSAYQLIAAVCAAGHPTKPDYWYYNKWGLYQSRYIFPAAADILYEAGFTYLEGRDENGKSPLAAPHESAMIVWLYRKGVSFTERTSSKYKECSAPCMPSMYLAIRELAQSMYIYKDWYKPASISLLPLNEDDFEALNILLQDSLSDCRDSCQCPCSSGGCSPEVIILKTILKRIHGRRPLGQPLPAFIQLVDDTIVELDGKLASSSFSRLSQAAIRMVLFLDLGIRHLCCKIWFYRRFFIFPMCQEEADEIRQEDRLPTERFEALLPKAQSAWEKSSNGFAKFWREFHRANICRRRNGPVDETELEKMRELGVMVHERGDEEVYCDSLYGDEEGYCESLSEDEGPPKSLDSNEEGDCGPSSPSDTRSPESSDADKDQAEVNTTE